MDTLTCGVAGGVGSSSRVRRVLGCALALLAVESRVALAQQPGMSPADVERITAEVSETMETYYSLFSQRRMDALADSSFTIPWMTFGGNGVNALETREDALITWQGSLIRLLDRGWDRSVFTVESVCVLNAGGAIVSGYNTRYDKAGNVMSVGGVTYILASTEAGWRIIAYGGSERGRLVRC